MVIANLTVKIIGALYSIPLINLIGKEANGYYSAAYNLYIFLFVLATAGLPVAISKMVSESYALGKYSEVRRVFRVSFVTFALVGLVGAGAMLFGAKAFAHAINNDNAYLTVVAIAPAVFFAAIMSAFRGYFQGLQDMVPTALSQILEAACKLLCGLGCAYLCIRMGQGAPVIAAGAISGVTIGSLLGALLLSGMYLLSHKRRKIKRKRDSYHGRRRSDGRILRTLIGLAIPITIGASVMSLTNMVDLFVVMNRLGDIGYTQLEANNLNSCYEMARKLFNLPASLVLSLGISVMPVLAGAFAVKDHRTVKGTMESALRICSIFVIPAGVGLSVLSYPILNLLFFAQQDMVVTAAPLLARLGFATTFVCLVSLTNSMLQAVGLVNVPVFTMLCGGVVKLVTNYTLIGIPAIGISGAPIGTSLCYGTITVLNLIFLVRKVKIMPNFFSIFGKPILASLAMAVVAVFSYRFGMPLLGEKMATVVAIGVAGVVYLGVFTAMKGFVKEDIKLLPKGDALARLLERRNLLG